MTREKLEKMFTYNMAHAALEFHEKYINKSVDSSDVCEAFEAGAEWALDFIIERACEWLELHINDDKYYSCIGKETLVPYLIEDFRKAMEE